MKNLMILVETHEPEHKIAYEILDVIQQYLSKAVSDILNNGIDIKKNELFEIFVNGVKYSFTYACRSFQHDSEEGTTAVYFFDYLKNM